MAYGENIFHFYNRIDRPEWARVRDELESWYNYHPDPDGQLRDHFRGKRHDQHVGAWWELYVFTFFRKLRYEITLHPELPNGRPDKPDFLISRDGAAAYVECKAVIERSRTAVEAKILDATNTASHPDFILELDVESEGTQEPSAAKIRAGIENWLQGLNADNEIAARDAGKPPKTLRLQIGGWDLLYTAHPVPAAQRGNYGRLLGLHSQRVVFLDNPGLIKKAVRSKGRKYTDVETQLDHPLIVALNTTTVFIDDEEIDRALYGARSVLYNPDGEPRFTPLGRAHNGYWCADPPSGTRISAVIFGRNVKPYGAGDDLPQMWLNPWARMPVTDTYGLATNVLLEDDQVRRTDGSAVASKVFNLPADWPLVGESG
ncbi:hypothetical protein A5672_27175 [Mycobacterium alsense]|uniref:Uncharacterized protein n=2 Tax=Mycobacterium alsense TaxID=324058 RepID=A0ABD6NVV8_9MYCO|nr:hypothetical protein A5672_27175 [Mycobacterium alsense]